MTNQQPYPTGQQWHNPPRGGSDASGAPYPFGRGAFGEPGVTPQGFSGDEKGAAILAHLSAPIAGILSAGSLSLLGPLAVWLIYKDRSPGVRAAAAGAFNFNLSWWLLYWVGWLFFVTFVGIVVAVPLWIIISIVALWCHIRGALNASTGRPYGYPFQLRVLR